MEDKKNGSQTEQKDVQPLKMCKFVDLKDGLVIKLEGYPLCRIRISVNRENKQYTILFNDIDGWVYRVKKSAEGELVSANFRRMVLEEVVCT